jgi:hypothetical protein
MNHSEFTDKFHWMNGLSEYYRFTGQEEKYEPIFKALYHNNYYRKRDIIMNFIENRYSGINDVPYDLRRAWINMLLNEHMDDVEVKPQLITSMIATVADDEFVNRIAKFIDYFIFNDETETLLPDLGDFLSRGQVKSKLWMVTEIAKIVDNGKLGNIVFYGGWYNFLAFFFFQQFDVKNVYTIDLNEDVIDPSKVLYEKEVAEDRFHIITGDVGKVTWQDNKFRIQDDHNGAVFNEEANVVINTSCEHMDNTWFEKLPSGTFVILQQNDYFSNEQHVNCCKDLEDVKQKYPMQNIFYEGELDTHLYNRFMLIGIK